MTQRARWRDRAYAHVRRLWPGPGVWLPVPFVVWSLGCMIAGVGRPEHVVLLVIAPLLAYSTPGTKRLFVGVVPMGYLGLVYDSMRYLKDVGLSPARVHLCDLRAIDMRIASVTIDGERGSVHDWLQLHPSKTLDLIGAVPYGTFLYVAIGFAIYLYVKDYERMRLFGWAFLVVNLIGFTTYHLYPAAPPWYFHEHGCVVDLAAHSSEGPNLARVDAMLGTTYFHSFYGRASDVFGAVPSLHVSYPLMIALFGWPVMRWPGRVFIVAFLLTMCAAAVYLDHHWIVDVLLGLTYAVGVYFLVTAVGHRLAVGPARVTTDGAREVAP